MKIVMLSGKQGSGKTTVQKALALEWQKRRGGRAICVNFADVLYEMHDKVLGVLYNYIPRRDIVKDGPLLQVLGTEWGRNTLGENIWVEILKERIAQLAHGNAHYSDLLFIIGDCRFMNEFQGIPTALRVRLEAEYETRKSRCSMWRENSTHPSEIGLDDVSAAKEFDLYLYTGNETNVGVDGCVSLIIAQLDKNVWMEKRDE